MQVLIGFLLGIAIGAAAWRVRTLTTSGAWAAALTGGMIFGFGGLPWAILLLAFFISSSLLSHAFTAKKAQLNEKFSKGSQRDWGQVFANGGLGALFALGHWLLPGGDAWWAAYIGALAAVNADTWATELGVLNHTPPRLITNGKQVERGSSGGVSLLGYLAVLSGAALIAILAASFSPSDPSWVLFTAGVLGGAAGATFDSFLGATVQAIYWCPVCEKETERHPFHTCGTSTYRNRGWRWLNNDWVNFLCSLVGAVIAAGIWRLFG
jgi:uncharacterized protein (TIGR00297 family)